MKIYPRLADYTYHQVHYGLTEFGIGCTTNDGKYFWPDMSIMNEDEYYKWISRLKELGYDIPNGYEDCFLRRKKYISQGVTK